MNTLKLFNLIRRCTPLLVASFFALKIASVYAAPDFMPVEEIKAGMRGIAKTVVSGNKIEEFGVEVIGVMKQKGPSGDLILVRTFGDVIERTGGIAQGMSGSPVYINDKLVGAIAYGWGLTDHRTGMVTPISDMLKLWDLPDTLRDEKAVKKEDSKNLITDQEVIEEEKSDELIQNGIAKDEEDSQKDEEVQEFIETEVNDEEEAQENQEITNEPEFLKDDGDAVQEEPETADEPAFSEDIDDSNVQEDADNTILAFGDIVMQVPKATSLMASGFSSQALAMLKKELKPYNLTLQEFGGDSAGNTEITYNASLEPGSMVGIELIRGDVNLSSMGTVTYVQDGKMIAFGHPFMKRGNVNYFLSEASVYTTLPGIETSFKLGTSGSAIGSVNQDRGAGIGGKLGVFPRIVPLRISVHDKTLENKQEFFVQVAHDEEITPILSAVTLFNAMEKTSDRTGGGTAKVKFEISAQDLPIDNFIRENMFYTNGNIGEFAISELFEAISILTVNQYTPVNIVDVKIDVEVEKERRTASIMEARASKASARPGETVNVIVKLKPYRQEPIFRKASFTVPKDQPAGSMLVSVRGGGVASLSQFLNNRAAAEENANQESLAKILIASRPKPKTFEESLKNLIERDRYNDIVLEVLDISAADFSDKPMSSASQSKTKKVTDETPGDPTPPKELGSKAKSDILSGMKDAAKKENQRKFNITTDHIIDGGTQFAIEVVN